MSLKDLFPIEQSNLFQEWQLEKKEIERLRWIESEKEGRDIGQERAEWLWMTRYRYQWKAALISGRGSQQPSSSL